MEDDIIKSFYLENFDVGEELNIRPAEWRDCRTIWKWRNDKTTREFSFNTEFIGFKEHKRWFGNVLRDKNRKILMIEKNRDAIGIVRFDVGAKDRVAEININVAPEKRKQGLGLTATKNTCNYAFEELHVRKIIAKIKKENVPSLRMFSRAGFQIVRRNKYITMELIPSKE